MHSNNFELNDDADSILYTDDRLTLIEMQIDEEIEPIKDNTAISIILGPSVMVRHSAKFLETEPKPFLETKTIVLFPFLFLVLIPRENVLSDIPDFGSRSFE